MLASTHVRLLGLVVAMVVATTVDSGPVRAQDQSTAVPAGVAEPADFRVGIGDILSVRVWREPDASADVVVRPDGKISLPLIGELAAAGMSTEELNTQITARLRDSGTFTNPTVTVVVTEINSRKVFISGEVNAPGEYDLLAPMTIVQLIATAGGFTLYADRENVVIIRQPQAPGDPPQRIRVNYDDIFDGKNLERNVVYLMPGDTVLVRE